MVPQHGHQLGTPSTQARIEGSGGRADGDLALAALEAEGAKNDAYCKHSIFHSILL